MNNKVLTGVFGATGAVVILSGAFYFGVTGLRKPGPYEVNLGPAKDGLSHVFTGRVKYQNGPYVAGSLKQTADAGGVPTFESFEQRIAADMTKVVDQFDALRGQVVPYRAFEGASPEGYSFAMSDYRGDLPTVQTLLSDRAAMDDFAGKVSRLGRDLWYSAEDPETEQDPEHKRYLNSREGFVKEVLPYRKLADEATVLSITLGEIIRRDMVRDHIRDLYERKPQVTVITAPQAPEY